MAAKEGHADDTRWLLKSNGERFWAEGMTTAIKDRSGELLGYAKITRDATERRKLESQLERSNDELQRFAYTVSHDLQEPLRTVRSYAELLTRRYSGKLDSDADEFIHFMMDAAGRMTQLLKDLLAYSQAGRPDRTTPEPTSSANILQWAIMNVDRLVKENGGAITYDPLPMVEADQTQLSQVFQNLLINAVKYRSTDPPAVHISAVRCDGMYEFSVTDNGIGIDAEHHERIFGVFKRLHGKEVPGTGIGLAICRKIIESHGGRIWVESEAGRGATFKFTLPAHD
jgi:light-regulated signal transduction histidine kinase (bacteriophytochrome)